MCFETGSHPKLDSNVTEDDPELPIFHLVYRPCRYVLPHRFIKCRALNLNLACAGQAVSLLSYVSDHYAFVFKSSHFVLSVFLGLEMALSLTVKAPVSTKEKMLTFVVHIR